jgi:rhodanese-related sulfurtransferase/rubrerythrin
MGISDYFKPVNSWTTQKIRDFIDHRNNAEYNLVDVRQPGEYEQGHLPGARLIPVGELPEKLAELDRGKTTIVYCAVGIRSRAAASILERAGFREVYHMAGGFNAWRGLVAKGFPDSGASLFTGAHSLSELTAVAWVLEDGTKVFYEKMAEDLTGRDASTLFGELAAAEAHHEDMLATLYRKLTQTAENVDFPALPGTASLQKTMEGGMALDDALAWSKDKTPAEILELCISLEAGSYDRYVAMQQKAPDENALKIFSALADEEKRHLGKMTESFERLL